ncbi:Pyridoxal-dependent decarboxylase domain-containing protein 1 [Thoreauomyces humboldtii]|nr:Pyridoxal-dependent decarboxylase domain-containing protein 1 [Thoreauomyces humboldtii]
MANTSQVIPVVYFAADKDHVKWNDSIQSSLQGLECATLIKSVPVDNHRESIDVERLRHYLKADGAAGRTPLLLVARVATPVIGQSDPFTELRALCDEFGVWLHIEGASFRHLETWDSPLPLVAEKAHSFSMDLGGSIWAPWISPMPKAVAPETAEDVVKGTIPFDPFMTGIVPLTLDDTVNGVTTLKYAASDSINTITEQNLQTSAIEAVHHVTATFPLWFAANAWDWDTTTRASREGAALMENALVTLRTAASLELVSSPGSPMLLVRYAPVDTWIPENIVSAQWSSSVTQQLFVHTPPTLRSALGLDLVSALGSVFIRFRPFHNGISVRSQTASADLTFKALKQEAERITSAFETRTAFRKAVEKRKELHFVDVNQLEGQSSLPILLGAIRYTPAYIDPHAGSISLEVVGDLDRLNGDLAVALQSLGTETRLFGGGSALNAIPPIALHGQSRSCVTIGLATKPFTIDDLPSIVDIVMKEAVKLERKSDFVARIANVIKQGIEEAERQLRTDEEEEPPISALLEKAATSAISQDLTEEDLETGVRRILQEYGEALRLTRNRETSSPGY